MQRDTLPRATILHCTALHCTALHCAATQRPVRAAYSDLYGAQHRLGSSPIQHHQQCSALLHSNAQRCTAVRTTLHTTASIAPQCRLHSAQCAIPMLPTAHCAPLHSTARTLHNALQSDPPDSDLHQASHRARRARAPPARPPGNPSQVARCARRGALPTRAHHIPQVAAVERGFLRPLRPP